MLRAVMFFMVGTVTGIIIFFSLIKPKLENEVFAKNISADTDWQYDQSVPQDTQSPSPTPEPTQKPTNPTPKPTLTPQPKYTSAEINGFIDQYSGSFGLDPNVLRHMALCESGFNPSAKNGSYAGLFQYGPISWSNLRKQMKKDPDKNLRFNAREAVETTAYALSLGKKGMWPNCIP